MIKTVELEGAETRYKLYFLQRAYDKMRLYVELCEDEIGWLGYVDKLPDNAGYMVTDVFLLDQEVHGATTKISPTAIIDYYNSLDDAGRDNFLKKCKIWGHSHVNMAPTPSGQDDDMGKELSKDVEDFYIRLITNKRGEYNVTFYDKTIKAKVIADGIALYNPDGIELRKQIQDEIKQKVKKKTYSSSYPYSNSYSPSKAAETAKKNYLPTLNDKKVKQEVSKINIDDVFDKKDYQMDFFEELKC